MTTDKAATIRKTLKALHGWTSRQVSVRSSHGSLDVTIKVPGILIETVKEIADRERSVRYDEATGCGLGQGMESLQPSACWRPHVTAVCRDSDPCRS